jgi:MoaA/NifB/PqqE/SkfB family radical SAM enzyme
MLVPVGCGQALAQTDMLSPQQYERMLVEICRLDARGELQMKVTCGPHYERVIREQGLYKARKADPAPISWPPAREARTDTLSSSLATGSSPAGSGASHPQRELVRGRSAHGGASRGCLAGLGVLFVGHQGNVFPCGYLPIKCGSIPETRLKDIWLNSKDLAKMRDS